MEQLEICNFFHSTDSYIYVLGSHPIFVKAIKRLSCKDAELSNL